MGKCLQIPYELFMALVKYHLCDMRDEDMEAMINKELEIKLGAAARHERYSKMLAEQNTDSP